MQGKISKSQSSNLIEIRKSIYAPKKPEVRNKTNLLEFKMKKMK